MPNGICTFFSLVRPTGMLFVICELAHACCVLSDLKVVFENTFDLKQYMILSHVLLSNYSLEVVVDSLFDDNVSSIWFSRL